MVTRIQHGTAEQLALAAEIQEGTIGQEPAQFGPSTRIGGGVVRYTAGQAETTTDGVARHSTSFAGTTGGNVLATLNSTYGHPSVELIPGDPSSRTQVQVAIREGLLRRNAAGQLENTEGQQANVEALKAPPQAPEQAPEVAPEDAHVFDHEADHTWSQDIAELPQHAYDAAIASSIGLLVNGRGSVEKTARDLAERAGLEPSQAEEYLDAGFSYYSQQVANALAPLGITGASLDEYRAFISAQPGKYQDAIQKLVHLRDPSGFREMAAGFRRANPGPEVSTMKGAGMQTAQDPQTGETLYRLGAGSWVTMAQLAAGK